MDWNYGDIVEALEQALPTEAPAYAHILPSRDVIRCNWGEFRRRTNNLGRALRKAGLGSGDKVAFLTRNHYCYLEGLAACFKAQLTHVNVNYRYVDRELHYILENSDSAAVIYGADFRDRVTALRDDLPLVKIWLEVGDETPLPSSVSYENCVDDGTGDPLELERSPEDQLFLYTGGTTGMPKGVMWEHKGLLSAGAGALGMQGMKMADYATLKAANPPFQVQLPACPMMHGTGLLTAMNCMLQGGCVVTLGIRHFDPEMIWDTVAKEKVTAMAIVGDAFGKPLLDTLRSSPKERWDISSLQSVVSSGVMWSPEIKEGLLEFQPDVQLVDTFGSSEGLGFGSSVTSKLSKTKTARFTLGERTRVFTEDHREVKAGSDEIGFVAVSGSVPVGYYKDPVKTASTFPVIDGVRYSIPGDYCRVEADGSLVLLGRGSVCINSAGEKIFPEEVEEVIKLHKSVHDALVVGVPDEKWGQAVIAVVEPENNAPTVDEDSLREHCRENLAGYKIPKKFLHRDSLGRAVNGKADYKLITQYAKDQLGLS